MEHSPMPVFDTHKAVKALCEAGFNDAQAEAVVEQINGADYDRLATKDDLASLASAEDLRALKEEMQESLAAAIAPLATKEELNRFATKEDLKRFATKEDLKRFATKEDLSRFATKEEVAQLEVRMLEKMDELASKLLRYLGGGIALMFVLMKGLDLLVG